MTNCSKLSGSVFLCFFIGAALCADAQPRQAEVQGLTGDVTFTLGSGAPMRVQKGTAIPPGALVRTGRQSALDLHLGPAAGTIRLMQSTAVLVHKLDKTQTLLTLSEGSLVGW